jgi:hypothetical protein
MSTHASEIYSQAAQASRYATPSTARTASDLFVKAQQFSRLAEEMAELARELQASGNAPTREAAASIIQVLA